MVIICYIVGILLLLGQICSSAGDCSVNTPGVNTFGPECQYMCHCKNGASCDTDTGECRDGCDTNWFGPACQYRDLAESQFSRHNSNTYPARYTFAANDGDTSTCSYTAEESDSITKPWWRVWFQHNETIRDIYILTMNDRLRYFPGFEVTVEYVPENRKTDHFYVPTYKYTCYQHDDTVPGSTQIHVQCEQSLVGNQVRITLSNERSQLVLCDVRIGAGRNFAFRKSVTASQYNNYPPLNAVDGRFGSTVSTDLTGCFVATDTGFKYLDINLGMSIYTYSVNINTTSDDNINDYKIYAATATQNGLQLVYDDSGNMPPVTYVHLNTVVQKMRIQTNNANQLVICELDIYGECPTNKCGLDCSENCYCKSHEDVEQRISGVCTTGCQGRWTGTVGKCNIECDEKKWGTQCQNDCGACRPGICDAVSGKCTGGCQDGYYNTEDCKSECVNGIYGQNCQSVCSTHCINGNCNKTNGACVGGCKAEYKGDKCDQVCQKGTFGVNCTRTCSVYCVDKCNHVLGTCTSCKAGWKGQFCDKECEDGTFGFNCENVCNSRCVIACDKENGSCSQCGPGLKGNDCDIECNYGHYGLNCAAYCGFCKTHTLCDKVTGVCPSGCSDGYTGVTCDKELEDSVQPNAIATIAGSLVAGIVVICATIVCIIMYRRRQLPPVIPKPESHGEISNNPTSLLYEDLQRNASTHDKDDTYYETIDPENI